MNTEEVTIVSNEFEFDGRKYDCELAIKLDTKSIIREAKDSHAGSFEEQYDEQSLRPDKVRIHIQDGTPVYCMIIYIINYKDEKGGRYACGNYYPFMPLNGKVLVVPHPYQASICW